MNTSITPPSILDSDVELAAQVPGRLRFAGGISVLPHRNGVAFVGGASFEVFEGYGVRQRLAKLLPLLDGSRSLDQVLADCEDLADHEIKDLIAHLLMSGLLRDGPGSAAACPAEQFIDRVCGHTGTVVSGAEGLRRLAASTLGICASPAISSELAAALHATGGRCRLIETAEDVAGCDHLLVVASRGDFEPAPIFAAANRHGVPALNVEVSDARARIGPFVLPRCSASYACYRAAYEPLNACQDPRQERVWAAVGLHHLILSVAGMSKRSPFNHFTTYEPCESRHYGRTTSIARLHGWDADGKPFRLPIAPGDDGYEIWKHYCGVALQSADYNPPAAYHGHYKIANISAIHQRPPAIYGHDSIDLGFAADPVDEVTGVTAAKLAALLRHSVGYSERNGMPQRFAPTGGNLGSTLALVLVFDVAGISPGMYYYDGPGHSLQRVESVDLQEAARALDVPEDAPAALLSVANAQKVGRKYGSFAINISWYDSGVMLSYARRLSQAAGMELEELRIPEQAHVAGVCKLPSSSFIVTGIMALRAARPGRRCDVHGVAFSDLLGLVEARQAVRQWSAVEVPLAKAEQVAATLARSIRVARHSAGMQQELSVLLVLKLADAPDGIYRVDGNGALAMAASFPRDRHWRLLSQTRLTDAPIIAVPTVDLGPVMRRGGELGMQSAYRAAGALVGDLWLHADALGLSGSACGGTFEGEIRAALGRHDLGQFTPLSLCLGPVS